jgi:hypothetical protein
MYINKQKNIFVLMGTRGIIQLYEENNGIKHLYAIIYNHWDSDTLGSRIKTWCNDIKIVNGIPISKLGEETTNRIANGPGCFFAQLIEWLKQGKIGSVYMLPVTNNIEREEFNYEIVVNSENKIIVSSI